MNLLAQEKSPYLLQHAHNPVDWYPWGPEAFERARQLDRPIFLSVGYSTCHWCHVMERESFEDAGIAALLNAHFVSVKVDREERPDVDQVYMLFVQATTGSGGWPMSVWLTPGLKPFFGGTYYPPARLAGLLGQIASAWVENRAEVERAGESVIHQLKQQIQEPGAVSGLDATVLEGGFQSFRRAFDSQYGGFGGAPKFPQPSILIFLLREHARTGNREALEMVLFTLRAMAGGGIHDRVGGGFHRYSVDERWHEPHYEKMLYDQAQLALAYLEAFELCGEEFFVGVARDILDYVLRDMTDAGGGFYSAEDADGAYYQIPTIAARAQRPRPHRDDKILTAWNGLMISAFAVAAGVLNEPRYLAAARAAASFVLSHLCDTQSGRLWRRFRQEEAAIAGFLDDYAFFTQGLLDLCEATLDPAHLATAERLTDTQRELFEDRERGGFYSTSGEDESLMLRLKDGHDGAEPSGNSVAALNLLRLAQITGRGDFRDSMERTFAAFGAELSASPAALPAMLVALGHSLGVPLPARIGARHYSGGSMERPGAVTLKGNPLTLIGPELHVGDKAPDFDVVNKTLSAVNLAGTGSAVRIFSVVPSLDTPVCDAQTKRFNDETAKLPGVAIVTVSMDLPFAQARWCGAFGVDRVMMLSDHKNGSFGTNYGTLIKELRIESRAIFVVDQAGVIRHVEYVKEVADHPDYEATLKAARALVV